MVGTKSLFKEQECPILSTLLHIILLRWPAQYDGIFCNFTFIDRKNQRMASHLRRSSRGRKSPTFDHWPTLFCVHGQHISESWQRPHDDIAAKCPAFFKYTFTDGQNWMMASEPHCCTLFRSHGRNPVMALLHIHLYP